MTPWTDVRMHLVGRKSASKLTGLARENMLREWAEGSRADVVRVTDAEGRDLKPSQIDWSTMTDPPTLRGRPPKPDARMGSPILVRVSTEERARMQAAADAAGEPLSAWLRDAGLARCVAVVEAGVGVVGQISK